jgi:hypothetical protein
VNCGFLSQRYTQPSQFPAAKYARSADHHHGADGHCRASPWGIGQPHRQRAAVDHQRFAGAAVASTTLETVVAHDLRHSFRACESVTMPTAPVRTGSSISTESLPNTDQLPAIVQILDSLD